MTLASPITSESDLLWQLRLRRGLKKGRRALRRFRAGADRPDKRPVAADFAARAGLAAALIGYAVYVSYTTLQIHYGFGTSGFDLGIFDQGVWLLSQFENPYVTVRQLHLFGDHTSFLLMAVAPIYWLFPSAAVLLIGQTVALAAGAIPLFLIARQKLRSEWMALACALAYLAHPAVAWTNFENFHPDSFEIPLVLSAMYFILNGRWRWFAACVVGLLLIKEDVPLLTIALGLYVALRHHRTAGLMTAGFSAIWLAAALFVVLPAFNEAGWIYASRLPTAEFGGIGGLLKTAVLRPWEIAAFMLGPEQRWYLWQLFASFGLLSLLAPSVLVVAAAPLAANLLTTFGYQHDLRYHYATLIVPVLAVSAVHAVGRFQSLSVRQGLVITMLLAAVTTGYLWGPFGRDATVVPDPNRPHAQAAREAISLIPASAGVSAHFPYVPHLTHRERIYEFPTPWDGTTSQDPDQPLSDPDEVDYVLINTWHRTDPIHGALVDHLERTDFETIFEREDVLLLAKRTTGEGVE